MNNLEIILAAVTLILIAIIIHKRAIMKLTDSIALLRTLVADRDAENERALNERNEAIAERDAALAQVAELRAEIETAEAAADELVALLSPAPVEPVAEPIAAE